MLTLGLVAIITIMLLDATLPFYKMGKQIEVSRTAVIVGLLIGVVLEVMPLAALFSASESPNRTALLVVALVVLGGGMIASIRHAGRSRYISFATAFINLACDVVIVACAFMLYATT